jgi:hypothetical protein
VQRREGASEENTAVLNLVKTIKSSLEAPHRASRLYAARKVHEKHQEYSRDSGNELTVEFGSCRPWTVLRPQKNPW